MAIPRKGVRLAHERLGEPQQRLAQALGPGVPGERRETLVKARQDRLQHLHIVQAGALGAVAQRRLDALLRARRERRLKKLGVVDESLAFADVSLTVAREPRAQGARRQRLRAQGV